MLPQSMQRFFTKISYKLNIKLYLLSGIFLILFLARQNVKNLETHIQKDRPTGHNLSELKISVSRKEQTPVTPIFRKIETINPHMVGFSGPRKVKKSIKSIEKPSQIIQPQVRVKTKNDQVMVLNSGPRKVRKFEDTISKIERLQEKQLEQPIVQIPEPSEKFFPGPKIPAQVLPTISENKHEEKDLDLENSATQCPLSLETLQSAESRNIPLNDNDVFILSVGKWGPNNQVQGFHETLFAATYINARIVLPPFYFHETDHDRGTNVSFVPGELRANTLGIPNLVSLEDYKKHCGDTPQAVILGSDVTAGSLATRMYNFQRATGVKILSGRTFMKDIEVYPPLSIIKSSQPTMGLNYVREQWPEIFSSVAEKHKCICFLQPFNTLNKNYIAKQMKNRGRPADLNIPAAAYDFAKIIRQIRDQFVQHYGKIGVGAHWRYNKGDWSNRCKENWGKAQGKLRPQECDIMGNLDLKKVGEQLDLLRIQYDPDQVAEVNYIAAPLKEKETIVEIAKNSPEGITILNSSDLSVLE